VARTAKEKYPHLYGWRWSRLRAQFLAENPLCVMCENEGKVHPAQELDHIEKHNGDPVRFYDIKNLQGLCRFHHRSVKARIERSGEYGVDVNGNPLDPNHHWNQR
jgi:5-methylcytosine-specific restriction endonuclease McrA